MAGCKYLPGDRLRSRIYDTLIECDGGSGGGEARTPAADRARGAQGERDSERGLMGRRRDEIAPRQRY